MVDTKKVMVESSNNFNNGLYHRFFLDFMLVVFDIKNLCRMLKYK